MSRLRWVKEVGEWRRWQLQRGKDQGTRAGRGRSKGTTHQQRPNSAERRRAGQRLLGGPEVTRLYNHRVAATRAVCPIPCFSFLPVLEFTCQASLLLAFI